MSNTEQGTVSRTNGDMNTMDGIETAHERFVHRMISAVASVRPETLAIVSAQDRMSYGELDSVTSKLAQHLRLMGVGPEDVVALWMTRSPSLIVAALATLKAGAAYLPLDPGNPRDRLLFMVSDCGTKVVITEPALIEVASVARCSILNLESVWHEIQKHEAHDPNVELHPNALAYVIYTSGSTGTPKGVEITHANLANLIAWHKRTFQITAADRASHLAGLGFDASVWETWPYLASGASLRLADADTLNSPEQLRSWLVKNDITISFVPTPLAERIIDMPWPKTTKLRTLLTGGDRLHARPRAGLPFTLVNNYGPTECAVVATSTVIGPCSHYEGLPAIGEAIDNTQVYIVNENLQFVADGVAGELLIGGANVGRGYRNRPELAAERFIDNPFVPGTKLYRTGDLGRRLPNGQIVFLGRADNQIKIRGYRIEPGEIAAAMNAHAAVAASAVVAQSESAQEKRLVGYVVADENLTRNELQAFLLERLPDYMVPAVFVVLRTFPLTANGKVDYSALPLPTPENMLRDEAVSAKSATELTLARIVSELLRVPDVAPDDDFFLLGGHSLLGTQLIVRIRQAFNIEVPLRALFEQPTVRGLAAEIERLLIKKMECVSEDEVEETSNAAIDAADAESPSSLPHVA